MVNINRILCPVDLSEFSRDALRHALAGVQGKGALTRLVFGSTTHHVIREAGCPVLTIRG